MNKLIPLALAAAAMTAGGAWATGPEAAMTQAGCMACHAKDKKLIGPSFKEIAAKYRGQEVLVKLMDKVRKGGGGVFGPIPMAPNPPAKISDASLQTAVEFILKTK